jgi:glycerol-3-phosphate cytidylyltransferase
MIENSFPKLEEAKHNGKKIGFACGVFDLFHLGHVLMLEECKQNCDFLVIALNKAENFSSVINPDKKKPIFNFEERKRIMESCKHVDLVISYTSETELLSLLTTLGINIRFLGDDYRGKPITGKDLDIEIYYTDRSHGLSTKMYREKIFLNG